MNRVILIQPIVGAEMIKDKPSLPLALLSISTFVEKEYEVKLIDQRISKDWKDKLKEELDKNPLCVATTSMTGSELKYALDISKFVKQNSRVPVVWGGVHASLLPKQTIENKNIDYVVQGEGEKTFHELVRALDKGKSVKRVKGLWYKERKKSKFTGPREFLDLNKLPEVPYHLVDVEDYIQKTDGRRTIILQTSRGCPFKCLFCYNLVFNKGKWRAMNVENSLKKIKKVVEEFKVEHIKFHDDDFFADLKRVKKILKGMLKYNVTWETEGGRINYLERMDKEYLRLMQRSGCKRLYIGVESGSQRILELIAKHITLEQLNGVSKKLKGYSFEPYYNFMVGFPTETDEDLKETINLIFKLLNDNPNARVTGLAIYTPYPGTKLFDLAIKEGLKVPKTLEEWTTYDFDKVNLPWINKEKKKILESLSITTRLVDKKSKTYFNSLLLKSLAEIYRPIARYRVKHLFFDGMFLEWKFKEIYERLHRKG